MGNCTKNLARTFSLVGLTLLALTLARTPAFAEEYNRFKPTTPGAPSPKRLGHYWKTPPNQVDLKAGQTQTPGESDCTHSRREFANYGHNDPAMQDKYCGACHAPGSAERKVGLGPNPNLLTEPVPSLVGGTSTARAPGSVSAAATESSARAPTPTEPQAPEPSFQTSAPRPTNPGRVSAPPPEAHSPGLPAIEAPAEPTDP